MGIEQMTEVSDILLILAVLFAVAAVALFFVFRIPLCWKMAVGKELQNRKKIVPTADTQQSKERLFLKSVFSGDTESRIKTDNREKMPMEETKPLTSDTDQPEMESFAGSTEFLADRHTQLLWANTNADDTNTQRLQTQKGAGNMQAASEDTQPLQTDTTDNIILPMCSGSRQPAVSETLQQDAGKLFLLQDIISIQEPEGNSL